MKLKSNHIYKFYHYKNKLQLPTLSIRGNADVYMSLKSKKPSSVNEMTKIEGFESDQINSILGMVRWICVIFDENTIVEDDGLVTSPNISTEEETIPYIPVPALISDSGALFIDNNQTVLMF